LGEEIWVVATRTGALDAHAVVRVRMARRSSFFMWSYVGVSHT
jgi:hypothetical protein